MIFYVDNIEIELTKEDDAIRLTSDTSDILFRGQTINELEKIIKSNYDIVTTYYYDWIGDDIDKKDIEFFSLKIVLRYLYMYNSWRFTNKNQKHKDLKFNPKDFEHPYTKDEIIAYFKLKHPENYNDLCSVALDMSEKEFKKYEKNRQDFFNMF